MRGARLVVPLYLSSGGSSRRSENRLGMTPCRGEAPAAAVSFPLRRKKTPPLHKKEAEALQRVKKASQSLPPAGGKGILIIFCRGAPQGGLSCPFGAIHLLYLTENTTQAASVRLVRCKRTRRARSRLQSFCQKRALPFFDSLKRPVIGRLRAILLFVRRCGKFPDAWLRGWGISVPDEGR